ncbi:MAG TPA: DinB family protein [Terriglobales bacterium]|nr:DinB family protein [Terriglobales bacterium]
MSVSQSLLPEFEQEMKSTRKTLERVPEDKFGWKPHDKSRTIGQLAAHLAEIPTWANGAIQKDWVDVKPVTPPPRRALTSRQEILDAFDRGVVALRDLVNSTADQSWMASWTLQASGKTLFTIPRVAMWRSFVMNHMIHHRAQLGVYLRINDVPLPSIYGPSADESPM